MPDQPRIAIIGGGLAGLSAAVHLAEKGYATTLYEASKTLGGRARGVDHQGTSLDNGQHILLGAYTEILRLLAIAEKKESQLFIRLSLILKVFYLNGASPFTLQTYPSLPSPLHFLFGLLAAKGLSLTDKIHVILLLIHIRLKRFQLKNDISVHDFLASHHQSSNVIRCLWDPLCLAALNTPIQRASAQIFLNVLHDSFNRHKAYADVLLPKHDLTSTLANPLSDWLKKKGHSVHLNTAIKSIKKEAHRYILQHHEESSLFDYVILACGPHQLKQFADNLPALTSAVEHLTYQPITTVYLQFPSTCSLPNPMQGVADGLSQWIFDRGQITGQSGLIAVVISAHLPFTVSHADLVSKVISELKQLWPYLPSPIWHQVITEKRATFSCDVGLERPDNITAYPNLCIAGDYTRGPYPATLEGAARSGRRASEQVILQMERSN